MKFLLGFFSLNWLRVFDFLAPLAIRLLLAPIFWVDGVKRLGLFTANDFVWFNPMTWWNQDAFITGANAMNDTLLQGLGSTGSAVIGGLEIAGAILLILGLAVRWIVLGLFLVVAVLGLQAIGGLTGAGDAAKQFFFQHGYTTLGSTPFALYITYFVLLLTLFFMGAGRWFSLDWYIYRNFAHKVENAEAARHDPFEVDATDEPGLRTKKF